MDIEIEMKKDLENAKKYAEMFDKVLGKIFPDNETVKKAKKECRPCPQYATRKF